LITEIRLLRRPIGKSPHDSTLSVKPGLSNGPASSARGVSCKVPVIQNAPSPRCRKSGKVPRGIGKMESRVTNAPAPCSRGRQCGDTDSASIVIRRTMSSSESTVPDNLTSRTGMSFPKSNCQRTCTSVPARECRP
jgi:hypothetical protein